MDWLFVIFQIYGFKSDISVFFLFFCFGRMVSAWKTVAKVNWKTFYRAMLVWMLFFIDPSFRHEVDRIFHRLWSGTLSKLSLGERSHDFFHLHYYSTLCGKCQKFSLRALLVATEMVINTLCFCQKIISACVLKWTWRFLLLLLAWMCSEMEKIQTKLNDLFEP